ncbi:uncharacterized protein AB675_8366 [Cyphellophora attinorum]|uniref:Aminoglycoside phosphotransferase domain-containing protein n=1 Tax=Cyphellophora attinorum TaxID=1664694 RepID=A0A0N1HZS5_9EURO|nr:uncharacterized protein AB675_8366 [Phialophora attinorum]KPI44416.1 hypothetical protein AB675_8366 [Phialophora attinorum]
MAKIEWANGLLGPEPRWSSEPDIDLIAAIIDERLNCGGPGGVTISPFASGCFNKLYKIDFLDSSIPACLLRVTLPAYPKYKTESEVATLRWLQRHTTIPVPEVLAFESSSRTDLGYEWILMKMLPGKPLSQCWGALSLEQKERIIKKIANYHYQLLQRENAQSKIGSLQLPHTESSKQDQHTRESVVGAMVHMPFIFGEHADSTIQRGPYDSISAWYRAWLIELALIEDKIRLTWDDCEGLEQSGKHLANGKALKELILEHTTLNDAAPTFLTHHDLHHGNILIDDAGNITGLVDWEFTLFAPKYRAFSTPKFLRSDFRDEEPVADEYPDASPGQDTEWEKPMKNLVNMRGKNNDRYGEDYFDWETTQLRRLYWEELDRLCPRTEDEEVADDLLLNFELAVDGCMDFWTQGITSSWVREMLESEKGPAKRTSKRAAAMKEHRRGNMSNGAGNTVGSEEHMDEKFVEQTANAKKTLLGMCGTEATGVKVGR